MIIDNLNVSTLYSLLKDIHDIVDEPPHVMLEYQPSSNMYRFRVIFNEFKVDELRLITKSYASKQYMFELAQDIRLMFNFKYNRFYEKD